MKRYIRSSLNSDLYGISVSSINGGKGDKLSNQLTSLLDKIPVGRYILSLGNRGYNTGYYKVDNDTFRWLYDGKLRKLHGYWDTNDSYYILPSNFQPSTKIDYEDDNVVVYEIFNTDDLIYSGLEDYEPMKKENWRYCDALGLYYLADYARHKIYIKWKVN